MFTTSFAALPSHYSLTPCPAPFLDPCSSLTFPPCSPPQHPYPSLIPPQVALGIPVPKFWAALMGRTIGHAAAERLVLSGRTVNAPEALNLGLVDAVVSNNTQESVLASAIKWMEATVKLPPDARAATKRGQREAFCAEWRRYYVEEEPRYGWEAISAPAAVAMMKGVLARLSGGGKGGKGSGGSKL